MGHGRDKRDPPARRCRSMGHGRDKRNPPARPSRRRQREGRACRVRLRNVEQRRTQGTSHSAPRAEGVRWGTVATSATLPRDHPGGQTGGTRLSRPPTERGTQGTFHSAPRAEGVRWGTVATSATLPRDHPGRQTGGTRLSRPPTERGTQGTSHSAPRATVATSATLPRAGAVRWGTVATSATLPRDPPGGDDGRDALVASAYGTWRPPAHPPGETSRDPPRANNKARREHASGRTGLAEGGGFEPPIR